MGGGRGRGGEGGGEGEGRVCFSSRPPMGFECRLFDLRRGHPCISPPTTLPCVVVVPLPPTQPGPPSKDNFPTRTGREARSAAGGEGAWTGLGWGLAQLWLHPGLQSAASVTGNTIVFFFNNQCFM